MKSEIRIAANLAVETALREALGSRIIPVTVGKKDGFAFDTGITDENGKPVYAVIEATVKNTEDTKTSQAFDFEAAVQARVDKESAPKKEPKSKASDPEATAKRVKREATAKMLEEWCENHLTSEPMTTSDIKEAIPELEEYTIMQVGSWLGAIAEHNPKIKREINDKRKPVYSLA